jgi:hypothetical protein
MNNYNKNYVKKYDLLSVSPENLGSGSCVVDVAGQYEEIVR